MPARVKGLSKALGADIQGNELPNLNPDSLLSLTGKIQKNFKDAANEKPRKSPVEQSHTGRKKERQSSQGIAPPLRSTVTPTASKGRKDAISKLVIKKPVQIPALQQGKKRLRDGHVKLPSNGRSDVNSTKLRPRGNKSTSGGFNIEDEILALGGTKDDYELVTETLSGSEIEGDDPGQAKASQGDLQNDLVRLVKELGVEKAQVQEQKEQEEQEEDTGSSISDSEHKLKNGGHVATSYNASALTVGNDEKLTMPSIRATGKDLFHIVCFLCKMLPFPKNASLYGLTDLRLAFGTSIRMARCCAS